MDLLGNRQSVTIDSGTPETYAVNEAKNPYEVTVGDQEKVPDTNGTVMFFSLLVHSMAGRTIVFLPLTER